MPLSLGVVLLDREGQGQRGKKEREGKSARWMRVIRASAGSASALGLPSIPTAGVLVLRLSGAETCLECMEYALAFCGVSLQPALSLSRPCSAGDLGGLPRRMWRAYGGAHWGGGSASCGVELRKEREEEGRDMRGRETRVGGAHMRAL